MLSNFPEVSKKVLNIESSIVTSQVMSMLMLTMENNKKWKLTRASKYAELAISSSCLQCPLVYRQPSLDYCDTKKNFKT